MKIRCHDWLAISFAAALVSVVFAVTGCVSKRQYVRDMATLTKAEVDVNNAILEAFRRHEARIRNVEDRANAADREKDDLQKRIIAYDRTFDKRMDELEKYQAIKNRFGTHPIKPAKETK